MRCVEKKCRESWLYLLCAIIWLGLAMMDLIHGDEWIQMVTHLALAFVWGVLYYRNKEE